MHERSRHRLSPRASPGSGSTTPFPPRPSRPLRPTQLLPLPRPSRRGAAPCCSTTLRAPAMPGSTSRLEAKRPKPSTHRHPGAGRNLEASPQTEPSPNRNALPGLPHSPSNPRCHHRRHEPPATLPDPPASARRRLIHRRDKSVLIDRPPIPDPRRKRRHARACNPAPIECRQPRHARIIDPPVRIRINGRKHRILDRRLRLAPEQPAMRRRHDDVAFILRRHQRR